MSPCKRNAPSGEAEWRTRFRQVAHANNVLLRAASRADIQQALQLVGAAFDAQGIFLNAYEASGAKRCSVPRFGWTEADGSQALSPPDDLLDAGPMHTVAVRVDGALWGTLQLLGSDDAPWEPDDTLLLDMVARHLSTALASLSPSQIAEDVSSSGEPHPNGLAPVVSTLRQMEAQDRLYSAVALLNPDGTVVYNNDLFASLCLKGKAPTQVPQLSSCLRSEDVPLVRDALQDAASRVLQVYLRNTENVPVHLHLSPIADAAGVRCGTLCWASTSEAPDGKVRSYANALQHRMRADRALLQASRLLVGAPSPPLDQLLRIVGQATSAVSIQMAVVNVDHLIRESVVYTTAVEATNWTLRDDAFSYYSWPLAARDANTRNGTPENAAPADTAPTDTAPTDTAPTDATLPDSVETDPSDGSTVVTTIPILSADGAFYGYIRLKYLPGLKDARNKDRQTFSVLAEMLCATLERYASHEAFHREQQRYEHFVDTISEAICRLTLRTPLRGDRPPAEHQVQQLRESAVVAECNPTMARLFGYEQPDALIGRPLRVLAQQLSVEVLHDLVAADFQLRNYRLEIEGTPSRYFVLNTTAMEHKGHIENLWVSCTEVTEQVMLERRMVEFLEQQQQQMGRDLHDRVSQQLAGTRMLMQNFSDRYFSDGDRAEGRRTIERIVEGVKRATRDVSDLQRTVMPIQVSRDGLGQALRELVSHADQHADICGVYVHDGTDVRSDRIKRQLYRIAQEAIRNALKHADASTIEVTLATEGDELLLRVADDGVSFDPERLSEPDAVGLYSMRYRARLIGAALDIHADADLGTQVECRLAVPENASAFRESPSPRF